MEQLFYTATPEFTYFLTTPLSTASPAPSYWSMDLSDSLAVDEQELDNSSQLDIPIDSYFDTQEEATDEAELTSASTSTLKKIPNQQSALSIPLQLTPGRTSSIASIDSWSPTSDPLNEEALITGASTETAPLPDLVQYLFQFSLTHKRVSVQSIALACVAAAVRLQPSCLASLESLIDLAMAEDPKLVGRTAAIFAHLIAAELIRGSGDLSSCRADMIKQSCDLLEDIMGRDVAIIQKAVCESLRTCLPPLLSSSAQPLVSKLLHQLMKLHTSSYWLLKVELLQTLAVLDYSCLAMIDAGLPSSILNDVVFSLIGDSDHRVRSAVAACVVELVANVDLSHHPTLFAAHSLAQKTFGHLNTGSVNISLAGIGNVGAQLTPSTPSSLDHVVWRCTSLLGAAGDPYSQRGALEMCVCLAQRYPPPTFPALWGCTGSSCGLLELVLQLIRGVCMCVCLYVTLLPPFPLPSFV